MSSRNPDLGDKPQTPAAFEDGQSHGIASSSMSTAPSVQPPPYSFLDATPVAQSSRQAAPQQIPRRPAPQSSPQPPQNAAGPSTSSRQPQQTSARRPRDETNGGLPRLDYSLYSHPSFQLSPDRITLTSQDASLSKDAAALETLVRKQATAPPKPQIHIKGVAAGTTSTSNTTQFDLRINLMSLLIPEDSEDKMDYIRLVSDGEQAFRGGAQLALTPTTGEGGLAKWCKRFVEEPAQEKSFTLTRVVANLDTEWLEGQLRSVILSTGFHGTLTIEFPVTHSKVVVQRPPKVKGRFGSLSGILTSLKPKTSPRFEVVQSVWPFASEMPGVEGRRFVVQSEEDWWKEWRDAIKSAVVTQKKGWVTVEDKLEALMDGTLAPASRPGWGEHHVYSSQESISKA